MQTTIRRIAASAATTAAAAACILFTAAPAQADAADCVWYLESVGYVAGEGVYNACLSGEGAVGTTLCLQALYDLRVAQGHANEACGRARW
ncbi:hypothetical protein [Nocardia abscessus]|uniref:hypothetical protein n=1 Tax=Nocardia abscessus TaxID=120957 RepID=UPI002458B100|nr:hypothetical protein [Nocardia abscessus]